MIELRANLIADTGRKNNLLIPSNALRLIKTSTPISIYPSGTIAMILSDDDLLKRSIFVPGLRLARMIHDEEMIFVPLYNGSHESFYVQDEMLIAELLIYKDQTWTPS